MSHSNNRHTAALLELAQLHVTPQIWNRIWFRCKQLVWPVVSLNSEETSLPHSFIQHTVQGEHPPLRQALPPPPPAVWAAIIYFDGEWQTDDEMHVLSSHCSKKSNQIQYEPSLDITNWSLSQTAVSLIEFKSFYKLDLNLKGESVAFVHCCL